MTQRRTFQVVLIYIKGTFGSVPYSQGKTLALLCVLKFGGKSIGFGGKVQPAFVVIHTLSSKEDLSQLVGVGYRVE